MDAAKTPELVASTVLCPTLIGRDAQRDTLGQMLTQARQGQGQIGLLSGEAGIGKSRLVKEIKNEATSQRFTILQGSCYEQDRMLPYAPWIDLLQRYGAGQTLPELAQQLQPYLPNLLTLLPELTPYGTDLSSPTASEPEQEKRQLFQILEHFLADEATPLLLVIEDLHWSDDTSLELLLFLTRRLTSQPILVLLTYRNDEIHAALAQFLAALDRGRLASELQLSRLTRPDLEMMIRTIFQQTKPVRAEFVEAMHTLTDGNPFFVEETLKAMVTAGDIYFDKDMWTRKPLTEIEIPRTVQDTVQRRSQTLSVPARQLLTLAAVAGRRFNFDLLQHLSGHPEGQVLVLIKELLAAQLVSEESADSFVFRHALTQRAIYAGLLARERQTLHRRIAEALEGLPSENLDPTPASNITLPANGGVSPRTRAATTLAANLAYHFAKAKQWPKTLKYAQLAGEQALALYAPRPALEHFNRALEASHHLDQPAGYALQRGRGLAHIRLSEFGLAQIAYNEALAIARANQDQSAEWQSLIDLGELAQEHDYGRAGIWFQAALDLARTFSDPTKLAFALTWLGRWHSMMDQTEAAWQCQQEALTLFHTLEDEQGLATTLGFLGWTGYVGSNLSASIDCYSQATALCRRLDKRQWLTFCLTGWGAGGGDYMNLLIPWPDLNFAKGVQLGEEAVETARQINYRSGEARALLWLALGLGPHGEFNQALHYAQTCLQMVTADEQSRYVATVHCCLGALYLDLLLQDTAQQHLETAYQLTKPIGSPTMLNVILSYLVISLIVQQDLDQAQTLLHEALTPAMPMHSKPQRFLWWAKAELLLAQGQATEALQVVEQMIATPPTIAPEQAPRQTIIPTLWYLRGRALVALDQLEEGEYILQEGQRTAQTQGVHALLWRIQAELVHLYQKQHRRDLAQSLLDETRTLIQTLASPLEEATLRANFIQQATAKLPTLTPPTPLQAAKQAYGGLTARERQVAALLAQGLSNRAIAEALFVQERTAAKHVENILSKLHFTSRAQIAVWAVEKGLIEASLHSKGQGDDR